jgi:hypothetical protein
MSQLGHTDPKFTLRVYAHAMRRGAEEREQLRALVEGREWAPTGTNAPTAALTDDTAGDPRIEKPRVSGASEDGRGWFRTSDLSRVKRALSH